MMILPIRCLIPVYLALINWGLLFDRAKET